METVEITIVGANALITLALFGLALRLGERVARLEGTVDTVKDILTGREKT